MNHYRLRVAFVVLHGTLGIVVLAQSLLAAYTAYVGQRDPHVLTLAAVETVAACLFLVPGTLRSGGALLLAVFASAVVLHALRGEIAWPMGVYSAAAAFVMIHGPVTSLPPKSTDMKSET
jgi:hypothetical protein